MLAERPTLKSTLAPTSAGGVAAGAAPSSAMHAVDPAPSARFRAWHLQPRTGTAPAALLKQVPFFALLDEPELQALAACCQSRRYKAGQVLFHEGEPGHALYVLRSGHVKVVRLLPDGSEMILCIAGPGAWLGEMALLDGEPRSATLEAIGAVEALLLPREAFLRVLDQHPAVARAVMQELARMVRRVSEQLPQMARLDVPGRIARTLLSLAEQHGEEDPAGVWVSLPLTREEFAQLVGAARTTVSTELHQLQARGILTLRREGILLHRPEALQRRVA